MSLVIDLIDLVAKHKAGELRCPATALIVFAMKAEKILHYITWASFRYVKTFHMVILTVSKKQLEGK